ncbi:MAG: ferrochelatase [Aeromonas sp.]
MPATPARSAAPKTGVVLVNLGTPSAPTPAAVKAFLRPFLQDKRVVDLPRALWWPLLNAVILPRRAGKVATLYQKIWTAEGSPLLAISRAQQVALQQALTARGTPLPVVLGMSYGQPSLHSAWQELKAQGVREIIVLPLYPHYSCSTTAAVFDGWSQMLSAERALPATRMVMDYHAHPLYIEALAQSVRAHWQQHGRPELLLLSYHGIPLRYQTEGDPYGAQCARTSELLAAALGLAAHEWRMSFQSRFGREVWLTPNTDEVLAGLPREGVHNVAVLCPGFAADCLETLEEIAVENRAHFLHAGGKSYHYIPALNSTPAHIALLAVLVTAQITGSAPSADTDLC